MQTNTAVIPFPMKRDAIRRMAAQDHAAGVPVAANPFEGADRIAYEHAYVQLQRQNDFEHAECA